MKGKAYPEPMKINKLKRNPFHERNLVDFNKLKFKPKFVNLQSSNLSISFTIVRKKCMILFVRHTDTALALTS